MPDPIHALALALARREVSYDLGHLHASHAWIEGDNVHVATVEERGMVRRQHRVELDGDDVRVAEERVTVCAECRNEVWYGHVAPGVEWREDIRTGRPYADGCEACCAALEAERRVA